MEFLKNFDEILHNQVIHFDVNFQTPDEGKIINIFSDGVKKVAIHDMEGKNPIAVCAKCHPDDKFDLKTGIQICIERYNEKLAMRLRPDYGDTVAYFYRNPIAKLCDFNTLTTMTYLCLEKVCDQLAILNRTQFFKSAFEQIVERPILSPNTTYFFMAEVDGYWLVRNSSHLFLIENGKNYFKVIKKESKHD